MRSFEGIKLHNVRAGQNVRVLEIGEAPRPGILRVARRITWGQLNLGRIGFGIATHVHWDW